MTRNFFQLPLILLSCLAFAAPSFAQTRACKLSALAALRPIPQLQYQCGGERDDVAPNEAERRRALDLYRETLEKLTAANWWRTAVEDLRLCDFRKKAGAFSKEEQAEYDDGYFSTLFGDRRFRVIAVPEPCNRSGFNELNVFLLNRVGRRVYAAEIIDGFVSRADFPLAFDAGTNGAAEPIIEIATTSGGLNPRETNYYFTIDKKTRRAVPKNMFRGDDGKMTNQISSMMLMDEAEEYGLPRGAQSLEVLKRGRMMRTFNVFQYTGEPLGANGNERLKLKTLRWNGKFYE